MTQSPPLNASADKDGLKISCIGDVRFLIHAEGITAAEVKQTEWRLPGLTVHISSDAKKFTFDPQLQAVEVTYAGITGMMLAIRTGEQ